MDSTMRVSAFAPRTANTTCLCDTLTRHIQENPALTTIEAGAFNGAEFYSL